MQLRVARLCLDCEEVHDGASCPVCASEAFAYLSRWVPAPERRVRPRPKAPPDGAAPAATTTPARQPSWVTRGAVGLTMLGLAGWLWHRRETGKKEEPRPEPPDESSEDSPL
jgi:hypothetical protein